MYHTSILDKYISPFFFNHSLTSKPFVTLAALATKLTYRVSVKLMFISLFCNSQIDLLLGLGLWYFLSDGSLISALGESDISVSLWYIDCQLLLVKGNTTEF